MILNKYPLISFPCLDNIQLEMQFFHVTLRHLSFRSVTVKFLRVFLNSVFVCVCVRVLKCCVGGGDSEFLHETGVKKKKMGKREKRSGFHETAMRI